MKKGFTLIELLVSLFVIALLVALLIPAVLSARASGKKIACVNNMRQIAIGMSIYESNNRSYPSSIGLYSPFVRMLPFVEKNDIYNTINFSINKKNFATTLLNMTIVAFLCPSDSGQMPNGGMTNYTLNAGGSTIGAGPFSWRPDLPYVGAQNISDGLATTALVSEWLRGTNLENIEKLRAIYGTEIPQVRKDNYSIFIEECKHADSKLIKRASILKGGTWVRPGFGLNFYNHVLTPNLNSCLNGTLTAEGAWTASSLHDNSINVVFADSHVSTIKVSIGSSVWRSLGTISGSELIGEY